MRRCVLCAAVMGTIPGSGGWMGRGKAVVMLWRLLSWGKGLWEGQKRCDGDCCLGGRDCGRGRRGVMGTAV